MKEYKLVRVKMTKDFLREESLMNKMALEGWEVVSVSSESSVHLTVQLLITFSREK